MAPLDLVRAHLAAEDARDVDATMATFTERCWYAIPSRNYKLEGQAAVRRHYEELFASFPDLLNDEVELFDAGSRVFARIVLRRRHTGAWAGLEPSGRRVVTQALAEFPIASDGLLQAEIVHMNPLEALYQIGAAPTQDAIELAALYRKAVAS